MIMARCSFARSRTWIRSLQEPVNFFLVALSTICQTVVSPFDLLLARPYRANFRDLIFSFSNVICNQVLRFEVCFLASLNTFGFVFPSFGNYAFVLHSFKTPFLCSINGSVFPFLCSNGSVFPFLYSNGSVFPFYVLIEVCSLFYFLMEVCSLFFLMEVWSLFYVLIDVCSPFMF